MSESSSAEIIDHFKSAMCAAGVETDTVIVGDGRPHRMHVIGDKIGSHNGWYVLHTDGIPAGAFGCFKRDINEKWYLKDGHTMSRAERQALQARMELAKCEHEEELARVRAACKAKAEKRWQEASEAGYPTHPYLVAKDVEAYGIRQLQNTLLVPVYADGGALVGLQHIEPDGSKRFMTGTAKAGSCHFIHGSGDRTLICEGYATGASLHEATGYSVAIAFDAGNLLAVAEALRAGEPDATLVLCADDDRGNPSNPGMTKATAAARAAGGLLAVPVFMTGSEGTDFNDMYAEAGLGAVRKAVESAQPPSHQVGIVSSVGVLDTASTATVSLYDQSGGKKSQATLLIELAEGLELFHDPDGTGFAIVPHAGARRVLAIRRGGRDGFKDFLQLKYLELTGKGASSQAMQDAVDTIDARARLQAPERTTHLRVAWLGDRIYLDLCDGQWRVVEIDNAGWRVLQQSPVMFVRRRDMRALPEPKSGGTIEALRKFVNVTDDDWPLIYGWLLAALAGQKPFPVLILQGEQGSGKSTSAKALKELLDPAGASLLAPPRQPDDMNTIAANMFVIALDNLSGISVEMSDTLCRIATGAGNAKRKLYTDGDLESVSFARPLLVNGIDEIANRADLMSRAIQPEMPVLADAVKSGERALWSDFEEARPGILGALLDMTVAALAGHEREPWPASGRLRDLQRWVSAAERGTQQVPRFVASYARNVAGGVAQTIEASPVTTAVMRLLDANGGIWSGNATALLGELLRFSQLGDQSARGLPQSSREIRNALSRAAPALRAMNIMVNAKRNQDRTIHLERRCETSSLSSSQSSNQQHQGLENDGLTSDAPSNVIMMTMAHALATGTSAADDAYDGHDTSTRAESTHPMVSGSDVALWDEGAV